jgi:hypothetical protein
MDSSHRNIRGLVNKVPGVIYGGHQIYLRITGTTRKGADRRWLGFHFAGSRQVFQHNGRI